MFNFIKALALLATLLIPQLAYANNAGVACVQNQLLDLEIDIGVADGISGPKTRDGLRKLVQSNPELVKFKRLTNFNALMWCRAIGNIYPKSKRHWPVNQASAFNYEFAGSLDENEHNLIKTAMEDAKDYFADRQIEIPGIVNVVASDEVNQLAKIMANNSFPRRPASSALRILKRHCSDRNIGGLNSNGLIVFCFSKDYNLMAETAKVTEVAVHEFAHEVQRQITGYTSTSVRTEDQLVDKNGPRWLVEATAVAFEYDYSTTRLKGDTLIAYLRHAQGDLSGEILSTMQHSQTVFLDDFPTYVVLASQLLSKDEGLEKTMAYWEYLATKDWQTSFKLAFGKTIDTFYDEFNWRSERTDENQIANLTDNQSIARNNIYVACVQRHLVKSDIDVGKIDGVLGPKTRAGLQELIAQKPQLARYSQINNQNALLWCSRVNDLAQK